MLCGLDTDTPEAKRRLPRSLRALGAPNFARWAGASMLSSLGDEIQRLAFVWWALPILGAMRFSVLMTSYMVSYMVTGLYAGVVADRYSRVHIMLITDVLRCILTLGFVAFAYYDTSSLWLPVAFAIPIAALDALFVPASRSLLPALVEKEDLTSAVAVFMMSGRVSGLVGAVVGTGILLLTGPAVVFAANALTFAVSAILVWPLRTVLRHVPDAKVELKKTAVADVKEALSLVLKRRWAWMTMLMLVIYFGSLTVTVGLAVPHSLVVDWEVGIEPYGAFQALLSGAGLISGIVVARLNVRNPWRLIAFNFFLAGVGFTMLGAGVGYAFIAMIVIGWTMQFIVTLWSVQMFALTPDSERGRISGFDSFASGALNPILFVASGAILHSVSGSTVNYSVGLFVVGAALVFALMSRTFPVAELSSQESD